MGIGLMATILTVLASDRATVTPLNKPLHHRRAARIRC
jgi:hypothetical protein